jgi:hypothetical protein
VVHTILHATARPCRGDPVGRPAGCAERWRAASPSVRPSCTLVAPRSTAMESPLPGTGRDHRRRGPSEVARRQDRPSPGAARRPLPGRERRLFVAPLGTAGSFLSASATEQTLPAGNVGATRWVAHKVRRTRRSGVAFCGTIVHDGARATHRVAPTPRACSRVRWAAERRGAPAYHL